MNNNLPLGLLGMLVMGTFAVAGRGQDPPAFNPMRDLQIVHANESCLLLRGETKLDQGKAILTLPAWFESYSRPENRSVQLTCKGGWSALWASEVKNGSFAVSTGAGGNASQEFWWEVKAVYNPQK